MRYISTFSGIEAASVAFRPLGWEAVAFSEIDPFPCAVLAERFPDVPNLGDITKVDWRPYRGKVDLVVGGSPCQSFSTAGKREGLQGESGLMFEFVRCVREVRPRWLLWENVPGALSSERGKAFGTLLHEMALGGGYGCAWRVLDAQFFGVPQQRRRVFLVGRAGNGYREACSVLFEPDFVPGNSQASKAKRAELAARAGRGARSAGFIANASPGAGQIGYEDECGAPLRTHELSSAVISLQNDGYTGYGQLGLCYREDGSSYTLNTRDRQAVMVAANQRGELRYENGDGQVSGAIPASQSSKQFQGALCMATGQANAEISQDVGVTLNAAHEQPIVNPDYVVRRLTPRECERLQGFGDDWTKVPYRGKPAEQCPDGPRYKAIGNSMCTHVMRWIGVRIDAVDRRDNPDEACSRLRGTIFGNV